MLFHFWTFGLFRTFAVGADKRPYILDKKNPKFNFQHKSLLRRRKYFITLRYSD